MRGEYVNQPMIAVNHAVVSESDTPVATIGLWQKWRWRGRAVPSNPISAIVFSDLDPATVPLSGKRDGSKQFFRTRSREIVTWNLGGVRGALMTHHGQQFVSIRVARFQHGISVA
jgi:hypothetical protein